MFAALIWRPLRNDWGRTLLSVLAIALGVAVVIAIRVANRSAIASFQQSAQALGGGADLLVTGPEPLPASLLPKLFPINAEAEILPYLDRRAYDPKARDTLEVLGLDLLATAGSGHISSVGNAPQPGSILIPADYARRHGLKAGGSITLGMGGTDRAFPIGAVLPAASAGAGDIAILDLPTALTAFEPGKAPMFDGLRVRLAPGAQREAVAEALRPLLPAADTVAPPEFQGQQETKMLAAFRANLTALAYVSLLIGIFLIYNTVSISVVRRRLAIATLRALGAQRRQVLRLFIGEGLVLALAGGVAGWGLGWVLARAALRLVETTINSLYAPSHPAVLTLTAGDLGWALALAAGAGVVAAWAPAWQAARIEPAAALRPGGAEAAWRLRAAWAWWGAAALAGVAYGFAHLPRVGGLPLFGFASALVAVLAGACLAPPVLAAVLPRLRRRWLRRGHTIAGIAAGALAGALRRSSILTAALAIAIGVMLGVAIMVGSFRQTVAIWIGQQLQADVFVRAPDWDRNHPTPLAPDLIQAILATPGAAAVDASHTQAWTFRREPIFLNTRWPLRGAVTEADLHFLSGGDGGVIVSEPFARRFDLWTGDRFTLATPHGAAPLRVSGVFYDYASDRGQIVLAPEVFTRWFGAPTPTEVALFAAPGTSAAGLRQALYARPELSSLVIHDNRSLRAEAMRVFDQTFRITYALEAITLLIAILGVANTLLAVTLERGPEFALLRLLGAARGQIRGILMAEAAIVATAALALGIGLGWVLAVILVRVINVQSFGWTIQFHPPYAFLIPAAAAVWLATLAAGWLPARAAERQATPQALEAE